MSPEKTLRRHARAIFAEALLAADPAKAVADALRRIDASRFRRIFVVGAGKASAAMARAAEGVLGRRIAAGLINTKYGHLAELRIVELNECGHPVPDVRGVNGARRILDLVSEAGRQDLVICLISGGGSALLPLPADGITLKQKQQTTRLLLACGATIHEINAVRKHLSGIKGGQLARAAYPAAVLSLLLSDVVGDPLDVIASGPTVPDSSTFQAAWRVIEKYSFESRIPAAVRRRLTDGARGGIVETPKAGERFFRRAAAQIVGSNRIAVDAAAAKAHELGYRPLVLSTTLEGETSEAAVFHCAVAREVRASGRPIKAPACLISGGETTVTLRGNGLGGRNQEFALSAAIALEGIPGVLAFSGGTDGTDGPTDAAGAMADGATVCRARELGLDAAAMLRENDSYHFFEPLGDLLKTGPTGTNVMDIRLVLLRPQSAARSSKP